MKQIGRIDTFGCFPSLPSAYSDSLSYYEELSKLVTKMNEIIDTMNEDYSKLVEEYLNNYFDSIMIDATYNESTETLILSKEISSTGSEHVYLNDTNTIEVK